MAAKKTKKAKKRNWREEFEKAAMYIKNKNSNFYTEDVPDFTPQKKKTAGEKIEDAFDEARRKTNQAYNRQRGSALDREEEDVDIWDLDTKSRNGNNGKKSNKVEDVDIWDLDKKTPEPEKKTTHTIAGKLDGAIDPTMKKVDLPRGNSSNIKRETRKYMGTVRNGAPKRGEALKKTKQFQGGESYTSKRPKNIVGEGKGVGTQRRIAKSPEISWMGLTEKKLSEARRSPTNVGSIKGNGERVRNKTSSTTAKPTGKKTLYSGSIDANGKRVTVDSRRAIENAFEEEEKKKKNPYKGIRGN